MLAPLAEQQLAAWEKLAERWLVDLWEEWTEAGPTGRSVIRCSACGKGIRLATDDHGVLYRYTHEQDLAMVVLHLRNHHADLDPDR